ncbi:MAG TPA: GNAT family N-acetyltransferase [Polyangiales bacterium]|nr:GNAT family N-acetyltransferase [Polyangiales bacterium]
MVEVRVGTPADLPRLVEIYNHYVVNTPITFDIEPFAAEQRRAWFDQHAPTGRHRLFVAEEAGVVLAYTSSHQFRVKPAYDSTVETTVYCAPESVRRGLGTLLYNVLFDALRGEDIASYIAGVTLPNEGSIALHARFGFKHVGTMHRVGRKFGEYWDVAWYERMV